MKLRNKAIITAGVLCIGTALCSFVAIATSSLTAIVTCYSLFSVGTFWALKSLYIDRTNQLIREISALSKDNFIDKRLPIAAEQRADEIDVIAKKINKLLDKVSKYKQQYEDTAIKKVDSLVIENTSLQQELSARNRKEKVAFDQEKISQISHYDDLTTLPNGIFFNEILNKAIKHTKRRKQTLAVLLIELDFFKAVRTTLGDENSNLVLKEISKRFTNVLRTEDILAKLDGDEFIVLLNDISKPKFASMVAEKILSICMQPMKVESQEFNITASIGVSIYPNDGDSLEQLFEKADKALFKVKQNGGSGYQFYTEEIHAEATEYIQMDSALRKAIHNNELALFYQPKFRIKSGTITGLEALMRWEHPVFGVISPAKFIPLAEESGLIMKVGEWALREACNKIKYWQKEGFEHVNVALKLSPKQFHHPEMSKLISRIITQTEINPKFIELEITEKTVMENVEVACAILKELKATGVQISIDHFGVGHTSISNLKNFPITAIKIDQSYIKGIPNNPDDCSITTAVIGLAHNLGLEVIGEGVETAEQVQFLSNNQCDIVQGYFLSYPVPAHKIELQFKKLSEEVLY